MTVDTAVSLVKSNAYLAKLTTKVLIEMCQFIHPTTLQQDWRDSSMVITLSHICTTVSFHLGLQKARKYFID